MADTASEAISPPLPPFVTGNEQGRALEVSGEPPKPIGFFPRLLLRFAALYFTMMFLSDPVPLEPLVNFAARNVWGITEPVVNQPSGSGDRLYDWLSAFCLLVLAGVGTALWTAGATLWARQPKARPNDGSMLHEYVRVILRYTLAMMIMGYGFAKTSQFPAPSYNSLAQPFGEETPMGLLWNFMGYSAPYALFSGAMEILAGFLLLFRRTTTLGALVFCAVMLNVFVLNLCYDVPVKLATFQYLIQGSILLIPDVPRLLNVFLLNRPTEPRRLTPPIRFRRLRPVVLGIKWIFIALHTVYGARYSWEAWQERTRPRDPIAGAWTVTAFKPSGTPAATATATPAVDAWKSLLIDDNKWGAVAPIEKVSGGGSYARASTQEKGILRLSIVTRSKPDAGSKKKPSFKTVQQKWRYNLVDGRTMTLQGELSGQPVRIELRRDEDRFLLSKPRFQWIQEYPRTP